MVSTTYALSMFKQNIDRLVKNFYRAAMRLRRKLVIDVYTANVTL